MRRTNLFMFSSFVINIVLLCVFVNYNASLYAQNKNRYELQEIYGDKVVVDHVNNLMWQQSGSPRMLQFDVSYSNDSFDYIRDLNAETFAGYNDWRLPTLEEAKSLITNERQSQKPYLYIEPIFSSKQIIIWTSFCEPDKRFPWPVNLKRGDYSRSGSQYYAFVRAVRRHLSNSSNYSCQPNETILEQVTVFVRDVATSTIVGKLSGKVIEIALTKILFQVTTNTIAQMVGSAVGGIGVFAMGFVATIPSVGSHESITLETHPKQHIPGRIKLRTNERLSLKLKIGLGDVISNPILKVYQHKTLDLFGPGILLKEIQVSDFDKLINYKSNVIILDCYDLAFQKGIYDIQAFYPQNARYPQASLLVLVGE